MYTDQEKSERFEAICQRIELGQSLNQIFKGYNPPLSNTAFYHMLRTDPEKNERYARAREIYADSIFEDILDIADESNLDASVDDDGKVAFDGAAVQRSRLKVDARKWVLSKLMPKKYGDRLELDQKIDANIKAMPTEVVWNFVDAKKKGKAK